MEARHRTPGRSPSPAALLAVGVVLVVASIWAFGGGSPDPSPPGVRVDPRDAYNPVASGEQLPDGFRQLLPRDAIRPVYDPEFVEAAAAQWEDETDVIGVTIGGQSKAYPVSFLNGRELVVDEIDNVPILVSW